MVTPIDSLRPLATRGAFALTLILLVATPGAASGGSCPDLPRGLVLAPDQPLTIDGKAFRISVRHEPALDGDGDGDGDGAGRLELDLLAEYADPVTGQARPGTHVPHLDVGYVLSLGAGRLADGEFPFTRSHLGRSYGVRLDLDALSGGAFDPTSTLTLDLTINRVPGTPDYFGECPDLPMTLTTEFRTVEVPDAREQRAETDGVDAPADDKRFTLLSEFDPYPTQDTSDIWGYEADGVFLAIMGNTNGTSFIDVTDPLNPVEVGFVSGPSSSWRDMKTYQNYAYITTEGSGSGEGMQIVDLSDPLNPVLVNTYNATFTTAHNIWIDVPAAEAWIWGSSNATRVLDLTDPVNPVDVGSFTPRYIHDGYTADGLGCFSEINNGLQEIADVTNPASITVLSSWSTPDDASHSCWADDTWSLLATTDETGGGHVAVYDVTVPTSPGVLLSEYDPNPSAIVHNIMFDDADNERLAIAHYALGGMVIDLRRPTAPVEIARYDTYPSGEGGFNGAWGVYAFDSRGYVYLSDIDRGLFVLRYDADGGLLSGVVRDAGSSDPIPEATVVALSDGTSTTSQSDGVYAFYVPDGPTQVRVSAWGFESEVIDAGTMPLDGKVDLDFSLTRLPRRGLSGVVRRSDTNAPVEGVTISLPAGRLVTTTPADGSYSFADVSIGQQLLTAEAFGYASGEARVLVGRDGAATLDFVLEPAAFADDGESDQGWGLGVAGDSANSGQWVRVDPNGTGGGSVQPEDDRTLDPAATAFITGQSNPGASTEANDVEGGFTTLLSPSFDPTAFGAAKLRYSRWLSTSAGFLNGGTMRIEVSNNGGATWVNLDTTSSNANFWNDREFDLASVLPITNDMRMRVRAEASSGFENYKVLEVAIDDVDVVSACVARFNAITDADGDGLVDACDACPSDPANDADGDGVCGDVDNAPFDFNDTQIDGDGDGVGDVADNCVGDPNADQADLDRDGLGDVCDPDDDGDGTDDAVDDDDDNDGVLDVSDVCPTVADPLQADRDSDGEGDACDLDDGEVRGLLVEGDEILWTAEAAADGYNVYRGDLGAEALLALAACRLSALPTEYAVDPELPAPGDGFFYLVSRVSGGAEGTLGDRSDGSPRSVDSPCP